MMKRCRFRFAESRIRKVSFAVAILALAVTASAEEDDGKSWVLGITEMPGVSSSVSDPASRSALSTLPALILGKLEDLDRRFPSPEEIERRGEQERLEKIYVAGAAAAEQRDKRDQASLSPSSAHKRASDERTQETTYKEKEKSLKESRKTGTPSADSSIPISLWSGHKSGKFLEDSPDPATLCKKEKIDYLIRWDIGKIGTFFRIRLEGWNNALSKIDYVYTCYCPQDDITSVADELAYAVTLATISRPSALITFQKNPAETQVSVDGRRLVEGRKSLRVYEERTYIISADASGYRSVTTECESKFGKTVEVSLDLERAAKSEIQVETNPEGASLYLDGIWAGRTPLSVSLYDSPSVAIITYSGYEKLISVLHPEDADGTASFTLEEIVDGETSNLEKNKGKYYTALSYFIVSIPVSILSYGVFLQNYYLHLEYPNDSDFSRRSNISMTCFGTAVGITCGLFVNSAIQLIRYIKSAR